MASPPERRSPGGDLCTGWWIARRYLLARGRGYASFINWVSFAGLALGVMILTVVISVMNGFDREITSRTLSAVPHAVVTAEHELEDLASLRRLPGVAHVSRYFEGEAMLAVGRSVDFIALAGVDAGGARHLPRLLDGNARQALERVPGGIVLGETLADARRLAIGDPLPLVLATPAAGGVKPRIERFELVATFAIGADADATLGIVGRDEIARRGLASAGIDGWRLHLDDPRAAPRLAERIRSALGGSAKVRFWMDDYGALLRAVKIEKAIMFALLALIVAIAAFNIVSGQAMLVNDKRGDVAMLTTMGASRLLLTTMFFLQGFAVAFAGVAAGLALGLAIAFNADAVLTLLAAATGVSVIEGSWFTAIPAEVQPADVAAIAGMALGVSLIAVLVPAAKAAAENPAEALHAA